MERKINSNLELLTRDFIAKIIKQNNCSQIVVLLFNLDVIQVQLTIVIQMKQLIINIMLMVKSNLH